MSTARSSATPSGGSTSARPTRPSRAGSTPRSEHGLHVIACVGETEAEREAGETEDVLRRQLSVLSADDSMVIAYEPVWAIGTGKTATPEIAQEAHAFIKSLIDAPVLYGGSVKPDNAAELCRPAGRRRRAGRRRIPRRGIVRSDLPGSFPLVTLVILDGWGCAPPGPGNAVELADTPVFDRLWAEWPHTTLDASGEAAGLPPGQMGNSEVGHLTIGAGRRLSQDLERVNHAIADGSLFENPVLRGVFERGKRVHLLGLVSQGGVHSHIDHLRALLTIAPEKTWIHAFTDGRDVSPHAAIRDLATLPQDRIATVAGRYYAMDRDGRWERTQRAFDAIVDSGPVRGQTPCLYVASELRRGHHRRVHRARSSSRERRGSSRATPRSSSTSGRTAAASSRSCSSTPAST